MDEGVPEPLDFTLFRGFGAAGIEVRYGAMLRDHRGNPAHAATYIRQRLIVLDAALEHDSVGCGRILAHEILHFAWVRLGNPKRLSWEQLLTAEFAARARGEAGWSAEWRKAALSRRDIRARTVAWRAYCCESFCDTGAWLATGAESEMTLARRFRLRRRAWFEPLLASHLPI